ncbi:hypothetical protein LTR67_007161 [Exophiala xenobiotica]
MDRSAGSGALESMQEHIRRAHPDYYIPKLPATEESFQLMISTPPSQKPPQQPVVAASARKGPADPNDLAPLLEQVGAVTGPPPTTANAAVALAQLHNWDSDFDVFPDSDYKRDASAGFELPSLRAQFSEDTLPPFQPSRTRELLPSILQSPGSRYSSLPPLQRREREKLQRPRKNSMGQNARKGKHERGKSREFSAKDFTRRLSVEGRKAMSAEPPTAAWVQGKRWEDLIEAATTATEADDDRDLTPMPRSPNFPPSTDTAHGSAMAASLQHTTTARRLSAADPSATTGGAGKRSSLPPGFRPLGHYLQHQPGQYNASPLQRALTPPPPDVLGPNDPEPFPSVESVESAGSGHNFHISASGLPTSVSSNDNTSPLQHYSHPYQHSQSSSFGSKSEVLEIYCASCSRPWLLKNAFACTECICGVCSDCVGQIISSPVVTVQPGFAPMRRGCPRCGVMGGKWKRFQLDFR